MKTKHQSLIGRTVDMFAENRRQRRLYQAVRGFNGHMLSDIGLERDDLGTLHKVR